MASMCPHCDADGNHWMTHDSRVQQIQDWLAECLDTHQACKWDTPSPPLPTRVLQLELGDCSNDVRLVDGRDRQGKYAALTYCWGPNPNAIFKTNSTNLRRNQLRIRFAKLNRLFREVIKILRSLGIIYLWIDALCIVQDSTEDWENEASQMASVYSNAYLTISASASTSPDDFRIPQYPITEPDRSLPPFWLIKDYGALSKRAWCLQERCLSRRIVHLGFGSDKLPTRDSHFDQMHWECPGASQDEHVNISDPLETSWIAVSGVMLGPKGFLNDSCHSGTPGSDSSPYGIWYRILDNYVERSLSFDKDRIPALSGLIDLFKRATGDSMVSGLWRADVPRGLIWSSKQTQQRDYGIEAYEPTTTLPSWSWLCAHAVSRVPAHMQVGLGAQAASFRISSVDESNTTITLRGTLFGFPPGWIVNGHHMVICGQYEVKSTLIFWDFLPESISRYLTHGLSECSSNDVEASATIWVLVIFEPQFGQTGWGLMMVRAEHPGTYRRVGLVMIYDSRLSVRGLYSNYLIHHMRQQPRTQTIKLR